MTFDVSRAVAGLERLRQLDPGFAIFASAEHRYQLNEPLSETAVARFEKQHSIVLPDDYRRYLTEMGNGGAGPAYGVFRLGEMDESESFRPWKPGDGFIGTLSAPFPHTRRWNQRPRLPKVADDHPDFERQLEEYDRVYWNPENVNGAIPICHLGCCLRIWLVITGRESGNVWLDERTDDGGLSPFSTPLKRRYTFGEWYAKWIKDSLRHAGRKKT